MEMSLGTIMRLVLGLFVVAVLVIIFTQNVGEMESGVGTSISTTGESAQCNAWCAVCCAAPPKPPDKCETTIDSKTCTCDC